MMNGEYLWEPMSRRPNDTAHLPISEPGSDFLSKMEGCTIMPVRSAVVPVILTVSETDRAFVYPQAKAPTFGGTIRGIVLALREFLDARRTAGMRVSFLTFQIVVALGIAHARLSRFR